MGDVLACIQQSVTMILSAGLSSSLSRYFQPSELLLVLACLHVALRTAAAQAREPLEAFRASLALLCSVVQFTFVRTLTAFVSGGELAGQREAVQQSALVNLTLFLLILEVMPQRDWDQDEYSSIVGSISFVFADRISGLLVGLGVPLAGAALALCLQGLVRTDPLLCQTLNFVSISTLNSFAFLAAHGKNTEIALAWPLALLYFIREAGCRYDVSGLLSYGVYSASDAVYGILRASAVSHSTIAITFVFVGALFPSDPVLPSVSVLVFTQGVSNWFAQQAGVGDPLLAALSVVTVLCLLGAIHRPLPERLPVQGLSARKTRPLHSGRGV
jgi:hypothetical protein